jgi:hypothetical protein
MRIATAVLVLLALATGSARGASPLLQIPDGGTGASTAAAARTNLGAAQNGANGDITSFTNLNSLYMVNTTAPASLAGGSYLTSVNGVMTWVSPYYTASLFGGRYQGDASRPWITSPIGIGVDWGLGAPQPQPNLRMQRVISSTSNPAADNVLTILHQSNELYAGGLYPIGITTNCNATLGNGVCLTGTVVTARGTVLHKGTVSFTSGNPVLTYTGAALTANQQVAFTTTGGTLPPPFVLNGAYYVLPTGLTANTVQLSGGVQGGAPVTPTAGSAGTINYTVMPQGEMWTWNPVCDDRTGRRSTLAGAIACMETDLNAAGPDDQHIRIIQDNVGREKFGVNNGPSPDGMTSIWTGIDVRPVSALASSGPVEITHAFYPTSVGGMPGSFNRYDFFSDTGYFRFYGASPTGVSAATTADAAAADTTLQFSNVFGAATALSGIKPGDKLCERQDCSSPVAIPAGTTVTAFNSPLNGSNVLLGTTTVTLSAPLAAAISTGTSLFVISVATDGLFLSGHVSDAVMNLSSQYGQEAKLVNGLQVGAPTGGAKGVGSVNATGYYANGVTGVSCAAGTVNATTMVFTNGILTHC